MVRPKFVYGDQRNPHVIAAPPTRSLHLQLSRDGVRIPDRAPGNAVLAGVLAVLESETGAAEDMIQ